MACCLVRGSRDGSPEFAFGGIRGSPTEVRGSFLGSGTAGICGVSERTSPCGFGVFSVRFFVSVLVVSVFEEPGVGDDSAIDCSVVFEFDATSWELLFDSIVGSAAVFPAGAFTALFATGTVFGDMKK